MAQILYVQEGKDRVCVRPADCSSDVERPHHSQGRAKQGASRLVDDSKTQVLQTLGWRVDKSGGERWVVAFHHGIPGDHHVVGGTGVRQLPKMRHHVGNSEGRIRVQGDGRDLELLIPQTGSVEGLQGGKRSTSSNSQMKRNLLEGLLTSDGAKKG